MRPVVPLKMESFTLPIIILILGLYTMYVTYFFYLPAGRLLFDIGTKLGFRVRGFTNGSVLSVVVLYCLVLSFFVHFCPGLSGFVFG